MSDRTTFICPHCHQPALIIDEDVTLDSDVDGGSIGHITDEETLDDIAASTPRKKRGVIGFTR